NDKPISNEEVHFPATHNVALVDDIEFVLAPKCDIARSHFDSHGVGVNTFGITGTQCLVNRNCRADDRVGQTLNLVIKAVQEVPFFACFAPSRQIAFVPALTWGVRPIKYGSTAFKG